MRRAIIFILAGSMLFSSTVFAQGTEQILPVKENMQSVNPALVYTSNSNNATEYTYGKFKYIVTNDDTITITAYTGKSDPNAYVTIPDKINGKYVTEIGYMAFQYVSIDTLDLPRHFKKVETWPFYMCEFDTLVVRNPDTILNPGMFAYVAGINIGYIPGGNVEKFIHETQNDIDSFLEIWEIWDCSELLNTWKKDAKGYWYQYADGSYPVNKWVQINKKWYYFDRNGYMLCGWQKINGKWYYLGASNDGAMKIGWQDIGGKWYYFGSTNDGAMKTGWQKISGKWYYLGASNDGAMKIGWQKINEKWYCFEANGVMKSGWMKSGGTWYYFGSANDGVMKTYWQKINGKWYYFDANGTMKTGWLRSEGTWYYLDSSGAMVTNTWIGNYYLGSDGTMV